MYVSIIFAVITIWFVGGVLYRESTFSKAASNRAARYNDLIKAMETEFGEYQVVNAARKHDLPLYCEPTIQKGKWGSLLGW
ncbi:hypothetical protein [Pseudomonas sp. EA_35y_Pfl2_R111]|uniref:hypothetical protein n=1 Tax=Pseudomonas sp. EA_35y_Pfl2_R111 TaxID=3088689 RepID=UPI0030DD0690